VWLAAHFLNPLNVAHHRLERGCANFVVDLNNKKRQSLQECIAYRITVEAIR
jgi:hypothetical protein